MKKTAVIYAVIIVLLWRVLTSTVLLLASLYFPVHPAPLDVDHAVLYASLQNGNFIEQHLLLPWLRWDTFHYISIATTGYRMEGQTVWPPLFPLLISILASIGIHPLVAALLVSTLASMVVVYSLFMMAHEENICSPQSALFFLLTFPVAFYLLAGYSEALFLALSLTGLRLARRKKLLAAGILAAFATLTRQMGVLLAVPLLIEGLRAANFQIKQFSFRQVLPAIGTALLPFLAFISFSLYVHFGLGYDFPWNSINLHGQHHLVFPGWGIVETFILLIKGQSQLNPFAVAADALLTLTACVVFVQAILHRASLPLSIILYFGVSQLVVLMFLMDSSPLVSASRYILVLFPIYLYQGRFWTGKVIRMLWFAISIIGNILLFGGFYAWLWIA